MKISFFKYFTLFFIACSLQLNAQNGQKKSCLDIKYNQFDFWKGSWNVYNSSSKLIGTNNIVKKQNNCVMQENWTSKTSSTTGTSYNYYNKTDDSWNQIWVDNSGFSLVLKGKLINEKMVLKSELIKSEKGNYYNRITWQKNKDESVTQIWEYLNEKEEVISEAFRGIYKKQ